jgi:hypothetical protein
MHSTNNRLIQITPNLVEFLLNEQAKIFRRPTFNLLFQRMSWRYSVKVELSKRCPAKGKEDEADIAAKS